jgi:hypothetical protein
MNQTFNIRRFGWFFKKTLLERPAQLIGLIILCMALSLVAYAFAKFTAGFEVAQMVTFMLGLIVGGCFLASLVYGYFGTNASGFSFLTLPVSQFEKWLCGVLITAIIYTVIFLLFFRLIDSIFVSMYHNSLDPQNPFYKEQYDAVQLFPLNGYIAIKTYMMFANFAGSMLVGSLYFDKAPFIKVALILCGLCFGLFLINLLLANIFFDNVEFAFPYYVVGLYFGKARGRLELPPGILNVEIIIFQYIIPGILMILAYMRLREKEF